MENQNFLANEKSGVLMRKYAIPDNFNKSFSGYLCLNSELISAFSRSFALPQELRHSVFLSILSPFAGVGSRQLNLLQPIYQASVDDLFSCRLTDSLFLVFLSSDLRLLLLNICVPTAEASPLLHRIVRFPARTFEPLHDNSNAVLAYPL